MDGMVVVANLSIAVAGFVVCILGLIQSLRDVSLEHRTRRYLVTIFAVLIVYIVADLSYQGVEACLGPSLAFLLKPLLFLESLLSSVVMLVLTAFMLESCGEEDWSRTTAFRVAAGLWVAYVSMLLLTQFWGIIYTFSDDWSYQRGPLYPVLLVPPVLIMLCDVVALWHRRDRLLPKQFKAFAICFGAVAISMLVQMFLRVYMIMLGAAIGAFAMFVNIQDDQIERYIRKELEVTRLRTDIMLSQIQPHFLCNALGAIGRLCKTDVEAKQAIAAFSRYLRENVNALSSDAMVPFASELEHAQTYLWLEQLRFEDDLGVSYDIAVTDFLMPTLTLQPLVENAVRHGVRGTEEGVGTVQIMSAEREDCWEIVVADDGPGFDPDAPLDNTRPHVGLSNVRERLALVCDGSLHIDTAPGRGCRVTIRIPKGATQ